MIYFVVQKATNLWVIGKKGQAENGSGIMASRIKAELSKRHVRNARAGAGHRTEHLGTPELDSQGQRTTLSV